MIIEAKTVNAISYSFIRIIKEKIHLDLPLITEKKE